MTFGFHEYDYILFVNVLILWVLCTYHLHFTLKQYLLYRAFPWRNMQLETKTGHLTQGKNDEIYIANNEGILKYDAERWTLYPTNSIVRSVACL